MARICIPLRSEDASIRISDSTTELKIDFSFFLLEHSVGETGKREKVESKEKRVSRGSREEERERICRL